MRKIYEFLELNNQKALDITLTSDRILSHVKRQSKKTALLSVLDNMEEVILRYSLKDPDSTSSYELQIIEIEVDEPRYCTPIIEAFGDAIPYALLIVFISRDKYLLAYIDDETKEYSDGFICSNWIYEEELSDELLPYILSDTEEYEEYDVIDGVLSQIFILVDSFYSLEYLCLRRLIDILKIREKVWDKEFVVDVLAKLYYRGNIEYLDEMVYVIRTSIAESAFKEVDDPYYGGRAMIDERYGVDNFYEKLFADEATTIEEAEAYYLNLERGQFPYR